MEETILSLLVLLATVDAWSDGNGKTVWFLESNKVFCVNNFCNGLDHDGSHCPNYLAKAIWKSKAPMKAGFLLWAASKGTIAVDDMLRRRNFNLSSGCAMCLEEEPVDDLFVHYHWAFSLWLLSLSLMGVSWVRPSNVKDILVAWRRRLKKSSVFRIWKLVHLSIWQSSWK